MGLEKPKDGAYQALEGVEKPINGAYEMCEAVCKPVNGAWEEIWNAVKILIESSNTITKGYLSIQEEGKKFYYSKSDDISGTGTITFYVEGDWIDPVISFDYKGYMYRTNAQESTWYTASAGAISLYSRTTDGKETTKEVVSKVGQTESGSLDISDGYPEEGSYSGTLDGSFNRIGISIEINGYTSATGYYNACVDMKVFNMLIDTTEIAFPETSEFDYE